MNFKRKKYIRKLILFPTIDLPLLVVLFRDPIIAEIAEVVSYKWCGQVVVTEVYSVYFVGWMRTF